MPTVNALSRPTRASPMVRLALSLAPLSCRVFLKASDAVRHDRGGVGLGVGPHLLLALEGDAEAAHHLAVAVQHELEPVRAVEPVEHVDGLTDVGGQPVPHEPDVGQSGVAGLGVVVAGAGRDLAGGRLEVGSIGPFELARVGGGGRKPETRVSIWLSHLPLTWLNSFSAAWASPSSLSSEAPPL